MEGLIHIYTGNGKGKTTAAVGLGIRACGSGMKVLMIQFLKGTNTGEMAVIEKLGPGFVLKRGKEIKKFTWNMNEEELKELKASMQELLEHAIIEAKSGCWDMLILDEVIGSVTGGLVEKNDVVELLKNKSGKLEVVMTGRNAPQELIDLADYISEVHEVKHPYKNGVAARKGIEY